MIPSTQVYEQHRLLDQTIYLTAECVLSSAWNLSTVLDGHYNVQLSTKSHWTLSERHHQHYKTPKFTAIYLPYFLSKFLYRYL
jgi:hypothetical protein